MAKQRALSITATVTQTAVDTDGTTKITQTFSYCFNIERFICDCIKAKTSDFNSLRYSTSSTSAGTVYYAGNGLAFWEAVDGILADASEAPSTITESSLCYSSTTVHRILRDNIKTATSSSGSNVLSDMAESLNNYINQYLRYLILSLSDEVYENLINVWKDRIVKTVNSLTPDLPSEVTLTYSNTHTTE